MTVAKSFQVHQFQAEQHSIQLIVEPESLIAWALQDEDLADFKKELLPAMDQVLILKRDGFNQIYIGPNVYKNHDHFQTILTQFASQVGFATVCIGAESDLAQMPIECIQRNFQLLALPTTTSTLRACVRSTNAFQMELANSKAEKDNLEETTENVKMVMSISRELNGERDIPKLLSLILLKAREITKADAGSIYTVEYNNTSTHIKDAKLRFRLTQNDSKKIDFSEFIMNIDTKSIVGNAVLSQKPINIPDLYTLSDDPKTNPYQVKHNRTFDQRLEYESHSMLTVPMFDISHRVIGVIQLINRKRDFTTKLERLDDFPKNVSPFNEKDEEYAEIIGQQAGIALENAELHNEIQHLFDGFVNASVTAIEQRDPTTSGHSHRVASLTSSLAIAVDKAVDGPYKDITFTPDQYKELQYASLLHDFGKLGVRENVLIKAKKLYPWQHENITERFEFIKASIEIDYLRRLVNYMQNPMAFPSDFDTESLRLERDARLKDLSGFKQFVFEANEPTVLPQGGFERLNDISAFYFEDLSGNKKPYLRSEELKALSVSRGSLTSEEFAEIQSHVVHTYEFLRKIPWGHRLSNVPEIAAKHHEKLDGSGYPTSASGVQIPVQSRIMAIADIYDALTASDRPYKKAVPVDKALDIIGMEVKGGKIDPALFELFIASSAYKVTIK